MHVGIFLKVTKDVKCTCHFLILKHIIKRTFLYYYPTFYQSDVALKKLRKEDDKLPSNYIDSDILWHLEVPIKEKKVKV